MLCNINNSMLENYFISIFLRYFRNKYFHIFVWFVSFSSFITIVYTIFCFNRAYYVSGRVIFDDNFFHLLDLLI